MADWVAFLSLCFVTAASLTLSVWAYLVFFGLLCFRALDQIKWWAWIVFTVAFFALPLTLQYLVPSIRILWKAL